MNIPIKSIQPFDGCHIFRDMNDEMLKIYFTNDRLTAYTKPQKPGADLINFCETDFSDLSNMIDNIIKHNFFHKRDDYDEDYFRLTEEIYNRIIKYEKTCYPAHIFIANAFNEIVNIEDDYEALLEIIEDFISEIEFILYVHSFFITALHICFVKQNDTYQERILHFFTLNHALIDYQFTSAFAFLPTVNGRLDSSKTEDAIHKSQGNLYDSYMSANENSDRINIVECIVANNIFDMYFYELLEIFKQGMQLNKCWYCGHFFIPKTKKTTLFCDRIARNGRTCKQVGGKMKFNAEKENDNFLKKYDKIYNRYYTRAERFTYADFESQQKSIQFSMNDFFDWSLMASEQRKKYLSGDISGDDMIKEIEIY